MQRGEHLWLHQRGWRSGGISSCQNPVPSWHGSGRGLEGSEQLLPQWCFSKAFVSFCGLAWSCPQVGLGCVGLRGAWAASRELLPWEFLVQELGRSRNPNGAEEQAGLVAPKSFPEARGLHPCAPSAGSCSRSCLPKPGSLRTAVAPLLRAAHQPRGYGVVSSTRLSLISRGIQAVLPPPRCLKTFPQALIEFRWSKYCCTTSVTKMNRWWGRGGLCLWCCGSLAPRGAGTWPAPAGLSRACCGHCLAVGRAELLPFPWSPRGFCPAEGACGKGHGVGCVRAPRCGAARKATGFLCR